MVRLSAALLPLGFSLAEYLSLDVEDCCSACTSEIIPEETVFPDSVPNPINFESTFSYTLSANLSAPTFTYTSDSGETQQGSACGTKVINLKYGSIEVDFPDCPTPAGHYTYKRRDSEPAIAKTKHTTTTSLAIHDGSAEVTCSQLTFTPGGPAPTPTPTPTPPPTPPPTPTPTPTPTPSPSPSPGPFRKYQTARKAYTVPGMDSTSKKVQVWYPTGTSESFPFISYSHGNTAGGSKVVTFYSALLKEMASYGYIIAAHESCDTGCRDDRASDPLPDPPRFKNMYKEQLKVIDWAKEQQASGDSVLSKVNFDIGVGVSGHSMGGQATVKSSSDLGAGHGIKAAVMHHAYTHVYPAPTVPFLAFTGSADTIAFPAQTQRFYNKAGANPIKGYVNKKGASHLEPNNAAGGVNLGKFSAAWFKIFLDETPQVGDKDFHAMIFGNGRDSLCGGGDGAMTDCELHDGINMLNASVVV